MKEKFSAESPLAVVHEFIQLQSNINNFQLIQVLYPTSVVISDICVAISYCFQALYEAFWLSSNVLVLINAVGRVCSRNYQGRPDSG